MHAAAACCIILGKWSTYFSLKWRRPSSSSIFSFHESKVVHGATSFKISYHSLSDTELVFHFICRNRGSFWWCCAWALFSLSNLLTGSWCFCMLGQGINFFFFINRPGDIFIHWSSHVMLLGCLLSNRLPLLVICHSSRMFVTLCLHLLLGNSPSI